MKKIFSILSLAFLLLIPIKAFSANRTHISDWYIKDFKSEITVSQDSTMEVTEKITADCGNLPDKHGIFRVLPTKINLDNGKTLQTPIELHSITDSSGNAYKYTESKEKNTITWKIGDTNKTVSGINYYNIKYKVSNVIRFQDGYDEFYWNLSGNYWEIPIDQYSAIVSFPQSFAIDPEKVSLYSGAIGNNNASSTNFTLPENSQIQITHFGTIDPGSGVTVSISFPSESFDPYVFSFLFLYGKYLFLLIPVLVFFICLHFWLKYGNDKRIDKVTTPEFEIPNKLDPMTLGVIDTQGSFTTSFVSAAIISFGVNKYLKIEEIEKAGILSRKDFKLIKIRELDNDATKAEKYLFNDILFFGGASESNMSKLKAIFTKNYHSLSADAIDDTIEKGYLSKTANKMKKVLLIPVVVFAILISFVASISGFLTIALSMSIIIMIIFILIASKYTESGLETKWKIEGFKMYMKTAEKYRQQFNEKENIFEKFLPYAILFGLTKIWIKKIKEIYGNDYFIAHPVYFYAAANGSIGDFNSMISTINSISSSISSSTGAGGSGGSGGGGGGGGGGGW